MKLKLISEQIVDTDAISFIDNINLCAESNYFLILRKAKNISLGCYELYIIGTGKIKVEAKYKNSNDIDDKINKLTVGFSAYDTENNNKLLDYIKNDFLSQVELFKQEYQYICDILLERNIKSIKNDNKNDDFNLLLEYTNHLCNIWNVSYDTIRAEYTAFKFLKERQMKDFESISKNE